MASMTISLSFSAVSSSISSASFSSQTKTPIKSHQTNLSSTLFGAKVCAHRTLRSKSSTQISTSIGVTCLAPASSVLPSALLFDCDGVLVDTEKDGHRVSFNDTFNEVIRYFHSLHCIIWFCNLFVRCSLPVVWLSFAIELAENLTYVQNFWERALHFLGVWWMWFWRFRFTF